MAIVISAVVWSAMHIDPAQLFDVFFSGLLYGWIYERTRSIWPTLLMHVTNNTFGCVVLLVTGKDEAVELFGGSWALYTVCAIVSLVVAAVCVVGFYKLTKRRPQLAL